MVLPALNLIVPTSVSAASGTASVSATGKVTFSAATTVSVNGCFSSTYDHFLVVVQGVGSGDNMIDVRLRLAGTDNSANSYSWQEMVANNTSVTGAEQNGTTQWRMGILGSGTNMSGGHLYFSNVGVAVASGFYVYQASGTSGAVYRNKIGLHTVSTAYDGFSLLQSGGTNITGMLCVYGISN